MNEVGQNLSNLLTQLPEHITLIAVSKRQPNEKIVEAYEAGHRDFGENKVQELMGKVDKFPTDARWHLIGHLQTNKVKYIAPFIHLVHSVDSIKLLQEIDKRARQNNRIIDVLLQLRVAKEEAKTGLDNSKLDEILTAFEENRLPNVRLKGLMGMATQTENRDEIRQEFREVKSIFVQLKSRFSTVDTLSMGMSGDKDIAIEEGSNMVRIGTAVFGVRNY